MFKLWLQAMRLGIAALVLAFAMAACGDGEEKRQAPADQDGRAALAEAPRGDPAAGEKIYARTCSDCHGEGGKGGFAPSHLGCDICSDHEALFRKIAHDMPKGDSGACVKECAADAAAHIYVDLNGHAL